MPDIIQLLPDSVANQIAAGEVVQRPASAVKELLENAIDAEATYISLSIKNAGKNLIQVIDNGKGMTETDVRMCIERHATSKITKVEDLFSIRTMGFRGEALPSIAAVAQLEIKSKKDDSELGTHLIVEGSKVISQEICQCPIGSNITVKNLFFNIPARRNFLKSNPIETKHIIEEFLRVALIHPEVKMDMINEDNEVYQLPKGNFRQRIVNIFGDKYNQRLVPVEIESDIVSISGFVGKPEFAKKTRGEQYFFVNERFIKSPYLNHAVQNAFEELLAKDQFPSYFLQLEVDPAKIDINIHPTKTEIKFEEERAIYAIIRTAVRQALGKYNIAPSLDFEQENSFNVPLLKKGEAIRMPNIQIDPEYNPFESQKRENQKEISFPFKRETPVNRDWEKLYQEKEIVIPTESSKNNEQNFGEQAFQERKIIQLHKKYLLSQITSGFILIDQERAHQRILIEKLKAQTKDKKAGSQQLLFPQELDFSASNSVILESLIPDLEQIGFEINQLEKNKFEIRGVPTEAINTNLNSLFDKLLEDFNNRESDVKNDSREKLIHSLARSMSIKRGKKLSQEEMNGLVDELFACEMPYSLPNGKIIVISQPIEDIDHQFKRNN
mgnify:CR=1 FL=1|tara:strand:- start:1839 stop:3674 length:1836 start_codon:yes stop_codon:yes gene_type:complete